MQIQKKRNTKALQGFLQIEKIQIQKRELQKPNLPGVYVPTISVGSAITGNQTNSQEQIQIQKKKYKSQTCLVYTYHTGGQRYPGIRQIV